MNGMPDGSGRNRRSSGLLHIEPSVEARRARVEVSVLSGSEHRTGKRGVRLRECPHGRRVQ